MKALVTPIRKIGWYVRLHSLYVSFILPKWLNFLSKGVNNIRPLTFYRAIIVLIMVLAVLFTLPVYAQKILWEELNDEVTTLCQQGRYSEAIHAGEEALKVAEETFNADHPYIATSLNNLALIYFSQDRYAEAEPLYKRALEILEKTLGTNHPDTVTILENMAVFYKENGKKKEALKLAERAERIRSRH